MTHAEKTVIYNQSIGWIYQGDSTDTPEQMIEGMWCQRPRKACRISQHGADGILVRLKNGDCRQVGIDEDFEYADIEEVIF